MKTNDVKFIFYSIIALAAVVTTVSELAFDSGKTALDVIVRTSMATAVVFLYINWLIFAYLDNNNNNENQTI